MSQHSIKILKNQSKQQKVKRFIKLSSVVLGIIISGGILLLYLIPENPVSVHFEAESKKNIYEQNQQEDLPGIDLKANDVNSQNSFDYIFSREQDHQPSSTAQPVLSKIIKELPAINKKDTVKPTRHSVKIEIPKKAPIHNINTKKQTLSIKEAPKTKIKSNPKHPVPHQLAQPFKIDSIDAIILLELDMPVSQH